MANIHIELVRPDYGFDAKDSSGHVVAFDSSPDHGGKDYGVRPMQVLLMGLGTCSGIDVVSILKKMRQEIKSYSMDIKGEREEGPLPAVWKKVHVVFHLTGDIEEKKALQAIELSIEKYCSVAETLRRAGCTITWELQLNNTTS